MVPATTFTLFPKLAQELKDMIWVWAATLNSESSPRVFWAATDTEAEEEPPTPQLIYPAKGMTNPALLTVNHDARLVALKIYTVWEVVVPEWIEEDVPTVAYINESTDIVYFRGMSDFVFFSIFNIVNLDASVEDPVLQEVFQKGLTDYHAITAQFYRVENVAISWEQLHLTINDGCEMRWFSYLNHLKTLTIVYRLREEDEDDRDAVTFTPVLVDLPQGTHRARSGKKILWWVHKVLDRYQEVSEGLNVPELRIKQFQSRSLTFKANAADRKFARSLDADYLLEGHKHFGDMPKV
jgi:hypothetical protein